MVFCVRVTIAAQISYIPHPFECLYKIMRITLSGQIFAICLTVLSLCTGSLAAPLLAENLPAGAIGLEVDYVQETADEMELSAVVAAYRSGRFQSGDASVLNFGIGAQPVWIRFEVKNSTDERLLRRLSIEPSWLDRVDVYFRAEKGGITSFQLGDELPFSARPIRKRIFTVDHVFERGINEVFIRVETSDPMVVALFLRTLDGALVFDETQDYSYGFLYGFLIALLAYNAMLYFGLRSRRYLYYAIYMFAFIVTNIAYTGHGYAWLWSSYPRFQSWIIPLLMLMYGATGLLFASSFLNVRTNFPRMHRSFIWISGMFAMLLLACIGFDWSALGLSLAFVFVFLFSFAMILLGWLAVRAGSHSARYFLLGTIAAMLGALITDLSVAGLIPFNSLTYRAVEIGMMIEATVLALALAHQFQTAQAEKFQAELMARIDPLTSLNNRRAFYMLTKPAWAAALRNQRALSLVMLDIDRFKQLNDTYGHGVGDATLIEVAAVLRRVARESDILARWGGEEFVLLLPETNIDDAVAMAERLRLAISELRITSQSKEVVVTASFGVAQRTEHDMSLDGLVAIADDRLYRAKRNGRNCVCQRAD